MTEATGQTLANQCYASLKEAIIRGTLKPGEKLRIEKLKSFLKVGPTPIREALSRLVTTGLVEMEDNRGFYVKKVFQEEIRDIYSTFNEIEKLALGHAMDHGDMAWEARIIGALYKLSAIENSSQSIDYSEWLRLNYEFHYAMVSACNSACILKIREDLYQQLDRFCFLSALTCEDVLSVNHQEHAKIAEAVIKRDKKMAFALSSQHLEKAMHQVLKQMKNYEGL